MRTSIVSLSALLWAAGVVPVIAQPPAEPKMLTPTATLTQAFAGLWKTSDLGGATAYRG